MPHALTCARSQQKGSEARLYKKCDENVADTTAKRKTPQKTNPFSGPKKYGHVAIPCKYINFYSEPKASRSHGSSMTLHEYSWSSFQLANRA